MSEITIKERGRKLEEIAKKLKGFGSLETYFGVVTSAVMVKRSSDGLRLMLNSGGPQAGDHIRVAFIPAACSYSQATEEIPAIRMSFRKPAEKCAEDIEKRLLPQAEEYHEQVGLHKVQEERYEKAVEAAEVRLIKLGAERYACGTPRLFFPLWKQRGFVRSLNVNYNGEKASITIGQISIARMEKVLKVLKEPE